MSSLSIKDLSILIVEPSITAARFIEDQLKILGIYNVDFCESGAQALASMRRNPPDLVASSMYLPDMKAANLLTTMREGLELEFIPFMLITTETSFAKLEEIRQAGIVALLPKPFTAEEMRKALINTTRFIDTSDTESEKVDYEQLRVLVVDDSLLARKHICQVLSNLNIKYINEAEDGTEAVEILDRKIFDIVFTDFNMPKMDGDKLILYIRNESTQPDIPVLMVTSEQMKSRLAAVWQAGVTGICDKPFDTESIIKLIEDNLSGS